MATAVGGTVEEEMKRKSLEGLEEKKGSDQKKGEGSKKQSPL